MKHLCAKMTRIEVYVNIFGMRTSVLKKQNVQELSGKLVRYGNMSDWVLNCIVRYLTPVHGLKIP